jgi:putative transposase
MAMSHWAQTPTAEYACQIVGVSRSCFYEYKFHVPSDREIRRLLLSGLVADIHKRSRGTYGMLRIRAALHREQGMVVNKKPDPVRLHRRCP